MTRTSADETAVSELLGRHEEPLRAFTEKLTDRPDALLERVRQDAVRRWTTDSPGELALPWLLRLVAIAHTGREPKPSLDLALVAAYLDLPRLTRALLWHVAVEGQGVEAVGAAFGMAPEVVLAQVRAGAVDLRATVLAAHSPEGRPAECQWLYARELDAPTRPLTRGELARGEDHACICAWCGTIVDQLALASTDLRSTMAVSVLGSLAPLYLATRPEPAQSLAPPVLPLVAGFRRTAADHKRPLIGAGVVAAVAAGIAGVVLLQPIASTEQVFTAEDGVVELRDTGRSGSEVVGGQGPVGTPGAPTPLPPGVGDGAVPAPDAEPGDRPEADPGAGPGAGTPGGQPGDDPGRQPGGGPGGEGPGDGSGAPGGPGTPGTPDSPGLLEVALSLDPIAVDAKVGLNPLVGRDQSVHVGLDKVALNGLIDLEVPLLGAQRDVPARKATRARPVRATPAHAAQRRTTPVRALVRGLLGQRG